MDASESVTQLLARAQAGDSEARDELLRTTYDELRRIARAYLRNERPDHTLQATALVNEACLRILQGGSLEGANRAQFLRFTAHAMRRVLISHARAHGRIKRGGGVAKIPFEEGLVVGGESNLDLVALDEALRRLEEIDPRKSQVVELRFFGGMTVEEMAAVLKVSTMTVKRDWDVAKTWLMRELTEGNADGE